MEDEKNSFGLQLIKIVFFWSFYKLNFSFFIWKPKFKKIFEFFFWERKAQIC